MLICQNCSRKNKGPKSHFQADSMHVCDRLHTSGSSPPGSAAASDGTGDGAHIGAGSAAAGARARPDTRQCTLEPPKPKLEMATMPPCQGVASATTCMRSPCVGFADKPHAVHLIVVGSKLHSECCMLAACRRVPSISAQEAGGCGRPIDRCTCCVHTIHRCRRLPGARAP